MTRIDHASRRVVQKVKADFFLLESWLVSPSTLVFAFNLLSGVVALFVSYYAFRFNRLVENSVLKAVSLGFGLLGVGLVIEAGISILLGVNLADLFISRRAAVFENAAFLVLQLLAYLVFALGYAFGAYGKSRQFAGNTALTSLPIFAVVGIRGALLQFYRFALASEFLMVLLLAFVVFQGILVYSKTRNRLSLMVLAGFCLIFIAHVLRFSAIAILSSPLYVDGTVVQFVGFLSLLAFLIRSGRIGST